MRSLPVTVGGWEVLNACPYRLSTNSDFEAEEEDIRESEQIAMRGVAVPVVRGVAVVLPVFSVCFGLVVFIQHVALLRQLLLTSGSVHCYPARPSSFWQSCWRGRSLFHLPIFSAV